MRLGDYEQALARLEGLIKNSKDKSVIAGSYQAIGEYYLSKKDYEASIKNYRSSIKYSSDNDFKAQMQFLIASVTAKQNPAKGSEEFQAVLKYGTSFELEYLTRYNHAKYLILSSNFAGVRKLIDELRIDYKEYPEYLSDIEYLGAKYYEQKKVYKTAVKKYKDVIINYPKTVASSDASFSIASYYENTAGDYLNAYRYYRYSNDENIKGHNAQVTGKKIVIFKKYFDLRSAIAGSVINTDYDSTFLRGLKQEFKPGENEIKIEEKIKSKGEDGGKSGGYKQVLNIFPDSLKNEAVSDDSLKARQQNITRAKFELAELFIYDIDKPDSAEKYLDQAYNESDDYDFKSKVMYALADLYRNSGKEEKYEETIRNIIKEYPLSPVADECRRLLNLPVVTENIITSEDSIFSSAENKFVSKEYRDALGGFLEIAYNYPASDYYAKSNYAAGWIYENILERPDSAYIYYTNVVANAPASELSTVIAEKLTEYENSLKPVNNDSLTVDSIKTGPIEENKDPVENKSDDNTNINDNGEGTPQEDADIKKEDKIEIKDPTK
jgi:tetratricopeptide (TPR) repeat protein